MPDPPNPRRSSPEINARLEAHEAKRHASVLEQIVKRQNDFEQWVRGVIKGQQDHEARFDRAISKRLDEQDTAFVSVARAVGVDEKHLPKELVIRSLPPPPSSPDETPMEPQKPVLPAAARYTRLALMFLIVETVHEAFQLFNHLYPGTP